MVRRSRTHILQDDTMNEPLTPAHLTKQEFARRVYRLMRGKGWTQSELSRRAGIPRDSISVYIRARSLPEHGNLLKLAEALGVEPDQLLANKTEAAIDADFPAFEMRVSPGAPDKAWLRVNRLVGRSTALRIATLLENDDAVADGGGGRVDPALQSVED